MARPIFEAAKPAIVKEEFECESCKRIEFYKKEIQGILNDMYKLIEEKEPILTSLEERRNYYGSFEILWLELDILIKQLEKADDTFVSDNFQD